jgi:hypothetical protein
MDGNDNGGVYQVERILDHRVDEVNGMEYLIRWCGYDSDNDTWEPADNVTVELKNEYHQLHQSSALGLTIPLSSPISSANKGGTDALSNGNGTNEIQSNIIPLAENATSLTTSTLGSGITNNSHKRKSTHIPSPISSSLVTDSNNINHNISHPNKMARPNAATPIKMDELNIAKQLNELLSPSKSTRSMNTHGSIPVKTPSVETASASAFPNGPMPTIGGVAASTPKIPLEPNHCLPLFDDSDLTDPSRWDRRINELNPFISSSMAINDFDLIRLMTHIIRLTHLLNNNSTSSLSSPSSTTLTIWSKRVQLFDKLITCPILIGNELIQSEWFLSIIENWLSLLIKSLTSLTQTHSATSEQHQPNNNNTEGSGSGGSGSATSIIIMIISNVLGFLNWLPLPYPLRSPSLSCIKLNHDINTLQQLPNDDNNNNNNNNNTNRSKKDSHRMTLLITRSKGNHYLFFFPSPSTSISHLALSII